jgi:hypothetical protein
MLYLVSSGCSSCSSSGRCAAMGGALRSRSPFMACS